MESVGEILKRLSIPKNISEGTGTSSGVDSPRTVEEGMEPQASPSECNLCKGAGFVYATLPSGKPDYSKTVPCRCKQREFEEGRVARLQQYSNLGPLTRFTFDNLIPTGKVCDVEGKERYERCYKTVKYYAENPVGWLVLVGSSGCGKTHMAAAIANRRIAERQPALFVVVADLLDHLRSTYSPESEVSYDELFEQVKDAPLLILDDLGRHSSTPWAEEKLYQIINHRYNTQQPTVITTSSALEDLDERLYTRLNDQPLWQICKINDISPTFLKQDPLELPLLKSMTLDNFDIRGLDADREQRQNLELALKTARDFAQNPKDWLVLVGLHGCGKTHLAAAIANHQRRQGKPVIFVVVSDLLDHLRSAFVPDSKVTYDALFETVKTTPLLILDDLETRSSSPWALEKLYQIINYRYNARLPTVITTTGPLENMEGRLSSRLMDPKICNGIPIIAPSYRGHSELGEKTEARISRSRRMR